MKLVTQIEMLIDKDVVIEFDVRIGTLGDITISRVDSITTEDEHGEEIDLYAILTSEQKQRDTLDELILENQDEWE